MEGVAKLLFFSSYLGQAQSDVQGRCRVSKASSSCAEAQYAYEEVNCVDSEGFPCNGAGLQSLLLG
jgi:hypothetical protein